jgi:hypothetical protein
MRFTKMEALFIIVPLGAIGAIVFAMADIPKRVGPNLTGRIRQCPSGRRVRPRVCTVDLDPKTSIEVDIPYGRAGDSVTIVKVRKAISGATYYVPTIEGEP